MNNLGDYSSPKHDFKGFHGNGRRFLAHLGGFQGPEWPLANRQRDDLKCFPRPNRFQCASWKTIEKVFFPGRHLLVNRHPSPPTGEYCSQHEPLRVGAPLTHQCSLLQNRRFSFPRPATSPGPAMLACSRCTPLFPLVGSPIKATHIHTPSCTICEHVNTLLGKEVQNSSARSN